MWNQIKRWLGLTGITVDARRPGSPSGFKWYEVGPENPFPVRMLDVRSLTWDVTAFTSDSKVAESYNAQRQSNGREFRDATIPNAVSIPCHLVMPHNGDPLEGIVFKSSVMEVKWDIYIYDSQFLFVRSWTGELRYRATAEVGSDQITVHSIETSDGNQKTARQVVYFLLATHPLDRVLPHTIDSFIPPDPQAIALWSFNMYGNLGCYATYEDITTIPISMPDGDK